MGGDDKRARDRRHDAKRRIEKPWRAFYKTPEWQAIRAHQLAEQPLCERHLARGEHVRANTVHHVNPHKGDWELFLAGPFRSSCEACHNRHEQREERGRPIQAIGEDGWPM